jgi:hypothetical protein
VRGGHDADERLRTRHRRQPCLAAEDPLRAFGLKACAIKFVGKPLDLGPKPSDLGSEPPGLSSEPPSLGPEASDLGTEASGLVSHPLHAGGEIINSTGQSVELEIDTNTRGDRAANADTAAQRADLCGFASREPGRSAYLRCQSHAPGMLAPGASSGS